MSEISRTPELLSDSEAYPVKDDVIQFYTNPTCPFAQRAWIALKKNKVDHEFIHIALGDKKPQWYIDTVNPRGTVPTLRYKGTRIFESSVVTEFIDEVFGNGDGSFVPSDPILRAKSRIIGADFGDRLLKPLFGLLMNNDESSEQQKKDDVAKGLAWVNGLYNQQGKGTFFLGETFTYADALIFGFLYRIKVLYQHYLNIDLFSFPDSERLQSVVENGAKVDFVQPTILTDEEYYAAYLKYASKRWDYKGSN